MTYETRLYGTPYGDDGEAGPDVTAETALTVARNCLQRREQTLEVLDANRLVLRRFGWDRGEVYEIEV